MVQSRRSNCERLYELRTDFPILPDLTPRSAACSLPYTPLSSISPSPCCCWAASARCSIFTARGGRTAGTDLGSVVLGWLATGAILTGLLAQSGLPPDPYRDVLNQHIGSGALAVLYAVCSIAICSGRSLQQSGQNAKRAPGRPNSTTRGGSATLLLAVGMLLVIFSG